MSYLGTTLARLAGNHDLRQADICRQTGLHRSHISRLFGGQQVFISDEDLGLVLEVFKRDKRAQAELVAARCMDARLGPGSELVEIRVKGSAEKPKAAAVRLSHETERAFAWLRSQCPVNPELERHLVGYARLIGMK